MDEQKNKNIIIDFDSTFSKVEALDILAEICLKNDPHRVQKINQIKEITDLGMSNQVSFHSSLKQRLSLLDANKNDLNLLVSRLKTYVSESFIKNKDFLTLYADNIYIVSNGFKEFIIPIVKEYGIKEDHVFANDFVYNKDGEIVGFNKKNVLSNNNGKVELVKSLDLDGEIIVIGDGYTDYEIKLEGVANVFCAFTENVKRKIVIEKADYVIESFDDFLKLFKFHEYKQNKKKVLKILLLEGIHSNAIENFKKQGFEVETSSNALDETVLCEKIKDVTVLGIRSKTQITQKVIANATKLISIGAFCIGTNQIDLDNCLLNGVSVFNAPFSNTRSVVEITIASIIMLMRRGFDYSQAMHRGEWNKTAKDSYEVRAKNLGIIGYGNIGSQLSVLAESFGMNVYYYDLEEKLSLGNAIKCDSLEKLLKTSDIVSLHVDGRIENDKYIGAKEFDMMKKGAIFINYSRGNVVDIRALRRYVLNKKIAGVAFDVFPQEPASNGPNFQSELMGLPHTILTPHIGGSTQEAQEDIASFVSNKIVDYINIGSTTNSVNFPNLFLPSLGNAHRLIHIHKNIPGILAEINRILASHQINIVGQYLKTNERLGYVITDIDKENTKNVIVALKNIEGTIKFRVL